MRIHLSRKIQQNSNKVQTLFEFWYLQGGGFETYKFSTGYQLFSKIAGNLFGEPINAASIHFQ